MSSQIPLLDVDGNPMIKTEYTSSYSAMGDAISSTASANTTTNIEYKVINQSGESETYKYLKGGLLFGSNIAYGDYIEVEIVDIDNILGAGAGYVVKNYVIQRFIHPTCSFTNNIESTTPGKIPIGLYVRFKYTAVAGSTRMIFINLNLQNKEEFSG